MRTGTALLRRKVSKIPTPVKDHGGSDDNDHCDFLSSPFFSTNKRTSLHLLKLFLLTGTYKMIL